MDAAVGGLQEASKLLYELIVWPKLYEQWASALSIQWPRGVLLHGPSGTGKTLLVNAIARDCGASLHTLSASAVTAAYAGESERRLRDAFVAAAKDAIGGRPVIIFIDEIDALCPRRDARRQQEARIVAQLLTLMDGTAQGQKKKGERRLLVVAATNRPNALDPALRRPGRFDHEIAISVPSPSERLQILKVHMRSVPLADDVDLQHLADMCHGYTGADLAALCRESAMAAMRCSSGSLGAESAESSRVRMSHVVTAMNHVGPSLVRGSTAEVPTVKWSDIGGLPAVKKRLQQAVEWPLRHAEAFSRLGLSPARGILLYGPPGCCKTTLAKAAAHASGVPLLTLSGAELFSMYVGEGEALMRETFRRARLAAPAILFLDEVDAVASSRSRGEDARSAGGKGDADDRGGPGERLLASLLVEMDGLEGAGSGSGPGVLVLAASNRPDVLDPALMRPGRFDSVIYVPPPDEQGRLETLKIITRSMSLADDVDLHSIAGITDMYTGAELVGVCKEAAMFALREDISCCSVKRNHFENALAVIKPSLTPMTIADYANFGKVQN